MYSLSVPPPVDDCHTVVNYYCNIIGHVITIRGTREIYYEMLRCTHFSPLLGIELIFCQKVLRLGRRIFKELRARQTPGSQTDRERDHRLLAFSLPVVFAAVLLLPMCSPHRRGQET